MSKGAIFITTCCKEKDTRPGLLPAIQRYRSDRITWAYAESQRLGLDLLILSGQFGLLRPEDPIPWYDHALQMEEIDALVPPVADELASLAMSEVFFIARSASTPGWAPYHIALMQARQGTQTALNFIEWQGGGD